MILFKIKFSRIHLRAGRRWRTAEILVVEKRKHSLRDWRTVKCKASFHPVRLFTFGNIRSSIIRATVGRIRRYRNPIYTRPLPIYTDHDNGAFKQCRTSCSGLLFRPYSFEFFQERFNREIPIRGRENSLFLEGGEEEDGVCRHILQDSLNPYNWLRKIGTHSWNTIPTNKGF